MNTIIATGGYAPTDPSAFILESQPQPKPQGRDILVGIKAIGMNPVDTKVFERLQPEQRRVLGWDACGVVLAAGPEAKRFIPGQSVYYAGDLTRDGANAEQHLVDERLVALAPASLSLADAACLPLTSLTAWEGLFDRLGFSPTENDNQGQRLLVIGGAGGVGSMVTQLAVWAGIKVAATASRPDSVDWCRKNGASVVVGRGDLAAKLAAAGMPEVDAIFCTTHMEEHWQAMAQVIAPQGGVLLIDDPKGQLDITVFKHKSTRICWEFMFTRSMFRTPDMARQGFILESVAQLVDQGRIRATRTETLRGLSPETIRTAHLRQSTGKMVGKQVIVL